MQVVDLVTAHANAVPEIICVLTTAQRTSAENLDAGVVEQSPA